MARMSRMIRDICRKVELLDGMCSESFGFAAKLKQDCLDATVAILTFFTQIVKFLRDNGDLTGIVYQTDRQHRC